MFELISDFTNYVPIDYLVDEVFGVADSAVDVAIYAAASAVYGFLK